ncbi:MAG: lmo0937 family membrane protein [Bacteroidia bacterium]
MGALLYWIAIILVILWLLGFLLPADPVGGNLIHILLVLAIIAVLIRVIRG